MSQPVPKGKVTFTVDGDEAGTSTALESVDVSSAMSITSAVMKRFQDLPSWKAGNYKIVSSEAQAFVDPIDLFPSWTVKLVPCDITEVLPPQPPPKTKDIISPQTPVFENQKTKAELKLEWAQVAKAAKAANKLKIAAEKLMAKKTKEKEKAAKQAAKEAQKAAKQAAKEVAAAKRAKAKKEEARAKEISKKAKEEEIAVKKKADNSLAALILQGQEKQNGEEVSQNVSRGSRGSRTRGSRVGSRARRTKTGAAPISQNAGPPIPSWVFDEDEPQPNPPKHATVESVWAELTTTKRRLRVVNGSFTAIVKDRDGFKNALKAKEVRCSDLQSQCKRLQAEAVRSNRINTESWAELSKDKDDWSGQLEGLKQENFRLKHQEKLARERLAGTKAQLAVASTSLNKLKKKEAEQQTAILRDKVESALAEHNMLGNDSAATWKKKYQAVTSRLAEVETQLKKTEKRLGIANDFMKLVPQTPSHGIGVKSFAPWVQTLGTLHEKRAWDDEVDSNHESLEENLPKARRQELPVIETPENPRSTESKPSSPPSRPVEPGAKKKKGFWSWTYTPTAAFASLDPEQQENITLTNRLKVLVKTNANLKSRLKAGSEGNVKNMQSQVNSLHAENIQLQQELAALKKAEAIRDRNDMREAKRQRSSTFQTTITSDELLQLKKAHDKVQVEKDRLQRQVKKLERAVSDLKDTLYHNDVGSLPVPSNRSPSKRLKPVSKTRFSDEKRPDTTQMIMTGNFSPIKPMGSVKLRSVRRKTARSKESSQGSEAVVEVNQSGTDSVGGNSKGKLRSNVKKLMLFSKLFKKKQKDVEAR